MMFQTCGGAWVKLGQMLALRADIVSVPLAFELLNLLENLPAVYIPGFDDRPIAVASFAQVYRTQLPDGTDVIMKVQKPGIAELVATDLKIMKFLARMVDVFTPLHILSAQEIVQEFAAWTERELDYELEAQNTEFFRTKNTLPWVKIPKIISLHTTKHALMEEYMPGVSMAQFVQGPAHLYAGEIARNLIETSVYQYFIMGRFHADPHPGNIIIDEIGALQYVDFGMIGETGRPHCIAMANFIYHTMHDNYEEAITAFLKLGFSKRTTTDMRYFLADEKFLNQFRKGLGIMESMLVKQFIRILQPWKSAVEDPAASFFEKSVANAFLKFLNIARTYHIRVDSEIALFVKTLIAVDATSLQIDPNFNLVATMKDIFAKQEYAWLFSPEAAEELIPARSEIPFAEVRDQARMRSLKEYYSDWFAEVQDRHWREFKTLTQTP